MIQAAPPSDPSQYYKHALVALTKQQFPVFKHFKCEEPKISIGSQSNKNIWENIIINNTLKVVTFVLW